MRKIFVPVRTGTKTCIWHRPCHNLRVRTAFHTIRSCTRIVFLLRPSRDFTGTKNFRTGTKLLFRIHLSMIYACVPRSTGTRMCILHRPCYDLRVRTAFHTVRCCCENHILRRSSQVRTGTIIFVPVRIHYFAYAFQRFSAFIPPCTGAKIIRLTPCHELLSARTSLD